MQPLIYAEQEITKENCENADTVYISSTQQNLAEAGLLALQSSAITLQCFCFLLGVSVIRVYFFFLPLYIFVKVKEDIGQQLKQTVSF